VLPPSSSWGVLTVTEKKWSDHEKELLKDLYLNKNLPTGEIAKVTGRTKSAVLGKIKVLKLRRENIWGKLDYDLCQKIIEHHKKGETNRSMAKIIGCSRDKVNTYIRRLKLIPNGNRCEKVDIVDEKSARCSKCKKVKPLSEFIINRRGQKYEYRLSYCHSCRRRQSYLSINVNIERYLHEKQRRLKTWCKKNNIIFEIDDSYLFELYKEQNGFCFYTCVKMKWGFGRGIDRENLSIDKIIPEKGYVLGNVVLCTVRGNTIKNDLSLEEIRKWLPPWYRKILKHFKKHNF
jgi:predicted DNA-binding protein YlxM (UPF0122 family)